MSDHAGQSSARRTSRFGAASFALAVAVAAAGRAEPVQPAPDPRIPIRLAFSSEVFSDVNENDARAAIKVWTQTIARQHNIEMPEEPLILRDRDTLIEAFRSNRIEACSLTTLEFEALGDLAEQDEIFTATYRGEVKEQYVLLVHQESGLTNLAGLRGRRLLAHHNPRTCLAPVWLDVRLAGGSLERATNFFSGLALEPKLTRVVLPVFFRQADACLVTRRGFENMVELNPQLGRRLRALETSPPYLPGLFCMRRGADTTARKRLADAILSMEQSPAGQQMLTLFQTTEIEACPTDAVDSALELLQQHRQVLAAADARGTPPASPY